MNTPSDSTVAVTLDADAFAAEALKQGEVKRLESLVQQISVENANDMTLTVREAFYDVLGKETRKRYTIDTAQRNIANLSKEKEDLLWKYIDTYGIPGDFDESPEHEWYMAMVKKRFDIARGEDWPILESFEKEKEDLLDMALLDYISRQLLGAPDSHPFSGTYDVERFVQATQEQVQPGNKGASGMIQKDIDLILEPYTFEPVEPYTWKEKKGIRTNSSLDTVRKVKGLEERGAFLESLTGSFRFLLSEVEDFLNEERDKMVSLYGEDDLIELPFEALNDDLELLKKVETFVEENEKVEWDAFGYRETLLSFKKAATRFQDELKEAKTEVDSLWNTIQLEEGGRIIKEDPDFQKSLPETL